MAYINSKRDGPHREEVAAKDFLQTNRTKINSLANHLTLGRWQELRNPKPPSQPQPSGTLWSTPPARPKQIKPYVWISYNGGVVIADLASGRQYLALATRENGIFDPLDDELYKVLMDLEGVSVPDETSEVRLEQIISGRLGLDAIAGTVE